MLVLSQPPGEKTFIVLPDGREMMVMVVKVQHGIPKIGFDAPQDIQIYREKAKHKTPKQGLTESG